MTAPGPSSTSAQFRNSALPLTTTSDFSRNAGVAPLPRLPFDGVSFLNDNGGPSLIALWRAALLTPPPPSRLAPAIGHGEGGFEPIWTMPLPLLLSFLLPSRCAIMIPVEVDRSTLLRHCRWMTEAALIFTRMSSLWSATHLARQSAESRFLTRPMIGDVAQAFQPLNVAALMPASISRRPGG